MDRVARVSAGSVILAARRTQGAMASAVGVGIDTAKADIGRHPRWRTVEVLAALALGAHVMLSGLRDAIAEGRLSARRVSRRRLGVELAAAGALAGGTNVIDRYSQAPEDPMRAEMAAGSLVASWRGMAYAEAVRANRAERSVTAAVDRTRSLLAPSVERTAKTEIASAYNDEHRAALLDMREDLVEVVMRRWDSANDKRTCQRCHDHDGEEVGIGEDFAGGDLPGDMHPNCLCVEVIVNAVRKSDAA